MAKKSTRGRKPSKNKEVYRAARNEKGQFVKNDYVGKRYIASQGKLVRIGNYAPQTKERGSQSRYSKTISYDERIRPTETLETTPLPTATNLFDLDENGIPILPEAVEHEQFAGGESFTITRGYEDAGSWRKQSETFTPKETSPKSSDEVFEFSYEAQAHYGYTKEKQREYYEILKRANERVKEVRDIVGEYKGDNVASPFSYNLNIPPSVLLKRILSAEQMASMSANDYIAKVAAQYKQDFIENFKHHIDTEDYEKLKKSLESLTDISLLNVLKNTNRSYLAYALDSIIDTFGYDRIIKEIELLEKDIEEEYERLGDEED